MGAVPRVKCPGSLLSFVGGYAPRAAEPSKNRLSQKAKILADNRISHQKLSILITALHKKNRSMQGKPERNPTILEERFSGGSFHRICREHP